jgi:hypothetical protein
MAGDEATSNPISGSTGRIGINEAFRRLRELPLRPGKAARWLKKAIIDGKPQLFQNGYPVPRDALRKIDVTLELGPGDLMRVAVGHTLSPWPAYGTSEIFELNEAEFNALIEGAAVPPQAESDPGPPKPRVATDRGIHAALKQVVEQRKEAGKKPLNKVEICEPVQAALAAKNLTASWERIQELYTDPRYDGVRLKQGQRWKPASSGKKTPKNS